MASGRSTNTMQESLQNVLKEISQMKTMPDANLDFLVQLETMILGFLRAPMENMMTQGQGGAGSTAQGAPPANGPSFAGAGVPGLMTRPQGPSPDEMRRLIQQG